MNFYCATKFENYVNQRNVVRELEALGHEQTYDWTQDVDSARAGDVGDELMYRAGRAEVKGIADADCLIVLWPFGESRLRAIGTSFEMGCATGFGKRVFLHAHDEDRLRDRPGGRLLLPFFLLSNFERIFGQREVLIRRVHRWAQELGL